MPVDTSSIDLAALIEREAGIRFGKEQGQGENRTKKAPCPFCGGTDRFAVFVHEEPQRFVCGIHGHGCGAHGDAITFLRLLHGYSHFEACEELGVDPGSEYKAHARTSMQSNEHAPHKQWRAQAQALCLASKELLWSETGKPALTWLHARGFRNETIEKAGIGYHLRDEYQPGDAWGQHEQLWIPRGITIPYQIEGEIWKINIRRGEKDLARDEAQGRTKRKYVNVSGGTNGLYGFDTIRPGQPLVLVEGELDRLALLQATKRVVVVATGGTPHARESKWLEAVQQASSILIAFDDDENNAGDVASRFWMTLPNTLRWLPWSHDINDMLMSGVDIDLWLETGLSLVEHSKHPDQLLSEFESCKNDVLQLLEKRQSPELGPETEQAQTDQCLCGRTVKNDPGLGRYLATSDSTGMYQCSACIVRCASIQVVQDESIEAMKARVLAEYAARPQEEQAQQIERRDFWQHIKQVVGDRPDYEPPAGCYDHISGGRSGYAALYSKKQ